MNSPTFLSKQTPARALFRQKKQPMPCTFIFSGESIMPLNLMTLFLTLISKLSHGFSDFLKVPPRCLVSGHYELEKKKVAIQGQCSHPTETSLLISTAN